MAEWALQEHQAQWIKKTVALSSTGHLPQKVTPQRQGAKEDQSYTKKQTRTVT